MDKNKRTMINALCSVSVLCVNILINFFLSPYIVQYIGVEANGFVTLANNFITYAQIIVSALNSMAARFITVEYTKKDYKKANIYYNSVFWGNLVIVAILIIPSIIFLIKMEEFINISNNILLDVKLLFAFIFFNFFLTTGLPNWDCGTFVSNRLDRTYIPNMFAQVLRCIVMFAMFAIMTPHVWYVGIATSIATIINLSVQGYNTKILTPELKISFSISKKIYSLSAIKELVGSGIWNSISSVGNMLLSGIDLIICNLFIGPTEMGILALSKIIPSLMQQLASSLRGAFAPELTINYANNNKDIILKDLRRAMKLTSFIMTIPFAIIVVLGDYFFALWVPTQDSKLLQILSVLAILGYMFTSGIQILFNVFTVVNKVQKNAIAMLLSGIISALITISLIVFTELDMFAVAGVSSIVNLVRNMFYTLPITSKYLGFKWYKFFPQVGQTILASILLIGVGTSIRLLISCDSWLSFIVSCILVGIVGIVINGLILLNKNERNYIFNCLKNKVIIFRRWL